MALIGEGKIKPSKYVSLRVPLSRIAEGFELARRPDVIKVMVYVEGEPPGV